MSMDKRRTKYVNKLQDNIVCKWKTKEQNLPMVNKRTESANGQHKNKICQ